jgi:hypothetical protein
MKIGKDNDEYVIAVIGTGSAGIISICHLLNSLPNTKVISVNNPIIPFIEKDFREIKHFFNNNK